MEFSALEHELKKLGITVTTGSQETIVSVKIGGLIGRKLAQGIQLADRFFEEKVSKISRKISGSKLFVDPAFGPNSSDPSGIVALCDPDEPNPTKGLLQNQANIRSLIKAEKLRWERPKYSSLEAAADDLESEDGLTEVSEMRFANKAKLFRDGSSSGDVIQGNLGDCWFLTGALSVVATRFDLLQQIFWRGDKFRTKGMFVCRFMKNFAWHYVIIDDRIPVFGYSKSREGKPYYARCRDQNELWVSLIEKAYAKLHGSYAALIGGFADVALGDLTGMCSEQVVLRDGYPGFVKDSAFSLDIRTGRPNTFWDKIIRYKSSGSLLGCSIQPFSSGNASAAPETLAGNGLYYKHAYAMVDAGVFHTIKGESVRLIRLRNPWGMGEWTGPWSDSSEERALNQDLLEKFFNVIRRKVGGNLYKRIFLQVDERGNLDIEEICHEEAVDLDPCDGTFFMSFEAWSEYFTHFFAGVDFPDEWSGRRVQGCWNEMTCGGNNQTSTWDSNPRYELTLHEKSHVFVSLCQEDPRGKTNMKLVPIAFHICSSLKEKEGKKWNELKEHSQKIESLIPPAVIPGTIIPGVNDYGTVQPTYVYKQNVSVETTMLPGKYCIVPSVYMRSCRETGKPNVGTFWISVYCNNASFQLEEGYTIAEEEEVGTDDKFESQHRKLLASTSRTFGTKIASAGRKSPSADFPCISSRNNTNRVNEARRLISKVARSKGIRVQDIQNEFRKKKTLTREDFRRKLRALGIIPQGLPEGIIDCLLMDLDVSPPVGVVSCEKMHQFFALEIEEDEMLGETADIEAETLSENLYQDGSLSVEVKSAKDLIVSTQYRRTTRLHSPATVSNIVYSPEEAAIRADIVECIINGNSQLKVGLKPFLMANGWCPRNIVDDYDDNPRKYARRSRMPNDEIDPVSKLYKLLDAQYEIDKAAKTNTNKASDETPSDHEDGVEVMNQIIQEFLKQGRIKPNERLMTLHKSNRLMSMEEKRTERFKTLQKRRRSLLGDKRKMMTLPRLIGGYLDELESQTCTDCNCQLLAESHNCSGTDCTSRFCTACLALLPPDHKLCDDCFLHESVEVRYFGNELRSILFNKLCHNDNSVEKLEMLFRSFDHDRSGGITYDEFSSTLTELIQPTLTDVQMRHIFQQFDTNADGNINGVEFTNWILRDQVWSPINEEQVPEQMSDGSDADRVTNSIVEDVIARAYEAVMLSETSFGYTVIESNPTKVDRNIISQSSYSRMNDNIPSEQLIFLRVLNFKKASPDNRKKLFGKPNAISKASNSLAYDHNEEAQYESDDFGTKEGKFWGSNNLIDKVIKLKQHYRKITSSSIQATFDILITDLRRSMCDHELSAWNFKLYKIIGIYFDVREIRCLVSLLENALPRVQVDDRAISTETLITDDDQQDHTLDVLYEPGDLLARYLTDSPAQTPDILERAKGSTIPHELSLFCKRMDNLANSQSIWRNVFGLERDQDIEQGLFIESLMKQGFRISAESHDAADLAHADQISPILTRMILSFAINRSSSERNNESLAHQRPNSPLNFSLFAYMIRSFDAEVEHLKRIPCTPTLSSGHQVETALVAIKLINGPSESTVDDHLRIYVNDPVLKREMRLPITGCDAMSGILSLIKNSVCMYGGLITQSTNRHLDTYLCALLQRVTLKTCEGYHSSTSCEPPSYRLSMDEKGTFLETLRNLFVEADPPFFWSLTSQNLTFFIAQDSLVQSACIPFPSHRFVVDSLTNSTKTTRLLLFLRTSISSLRVRFHLVGSFSDSYTCTWTDFQNQLIGNYDFYATIQLHPHGKLHRTHVYHSENTTALWNYRSQLIVQQPEFATERIDMPIVYSDTIRISAAPDHYRTEKISFLRCDEGEMGYCLIVHVRKAIPLKRGDESRLYCTAYDPLTSSDYAVTGYPDVWPIDFFDPKANPHFEKSWQAMIPILELDVPLTPQLICKVYNRQKKTETLLGERRISVASAFSREGYLVEECFTLLHPKSEKLPAGMVNISFRFDLNETALSIPLSEKLPAVTEKVADNAEENISVQVSKTTSKTSDHSYAHKSGRLEELENELIITENAKQYAIRDADALRLQLQSLRRIKEKEISRTTRWRDKHEETQKELYSMQQEYEERIQLLQQQAEAYRTGDNSQHQQSLPIADRRNRSEDTRQETPAKVPEGNGVLVLLRDTLYDRCQDRPFNGLKKAFAAVAESPGKISVDAFQEVLRDFGFHFNEMEQSQLITLLNPDSYGRMTIEDFFIKLSGNNGKPTSPTAYKPGRNNNIHFDWDDQASVGKLIEPSHTQVSKSSPEESLNTISRGRRSSINQMTRPSQTSEKVATKAFGSRKSQVRSWKEFKQMMILRLPDGWDMRISDKGRPYFCNHLDRSHQSS
uniref:Cysteine protease family C02 putative n=1 Tax=Albugo laibachii Nc14 TaxID=890382 RepID=F0W2B6_9STRA|nr:cysteine protease family C02 putative [Albugo laibachii Nc14]|eukprot:CCA15201.1 cysteine protease family C02 putative [Albugo laibachii Nc14]